MPADRPDAAPVGADRVLPPVDGEPALRLGVTGTDTNIGKTVVSCALIACARAFGLSVAAMKPLETGIGDRAFTDGTPLPSDAERLVQANGGRDPLDVVRPVALPEPLAPMVAAERADVPIDVRLLDAAMQRLAVGRDMLLVEGAGGLLVPVNRELDYLGLYARWRCDLVVVSGNRLGVLNHTLLTVRVAEQAGLRIRAVVLTALTDREPSVAEATNFDALRRLLPAHIPLHRLPWVDRWNDPDALAAAAQGTGLDAVLTSTGAD
jgi:dethiobiotin synthetase